MAKNDKIIYAPGELDRVRSNLGKIDKDEAKRIAEKLGGDIGYERTAEQEKARQKPRRTRQGRTNGGIGGRPAAPGRRVEPAAENGAGRKPSPRKELRPADNPAIPIKVSYWDRIKMDRYAAQSEFEIKSSFQVLSSVLSIFGEIPDYVNPAFVVRRMGEYYKHIETMVVSTRNLFPRNNMRRNERMRKAAPLVFTILDTIRRWNIEGISGDLARLQARPRNVKVGDFADILRAVYKPLFILDRLDMEAHIRGSYKILYKMLYIENPMDAQSKYQDQIRTALAAYGGVRRDIRYLLYPLLMKTVSAQWLPYDRFFSERKNRIMTFLNVTENDQISPGAIVAGPVEAGAEEEKKAVPKEGGEEAETDETGEEKLSEEEKSRRAAAEAEKRALDRGLQTLESLFPKAGWDRLPSYPDLYPYFVDIFDLKKGVVNIAPTDPLQQIFILMRILKELFFGLRYVSFGTVAGSNGGPEKANDILMNIINNWHYYIEVSFEKTYLPKMAEYIRILEGSPENRNAPYAKKLHSDLRWLKRLYFLPFYKFESLAPPPIQKKDITPMYAEIRKLRKYLTAVAAGIEQGVRAGGAENRAPCGGIDNPWDPYVFQVPNPLSRRLDALLSDKARNNASLVFFTLAVTAVLDYLVNDEESWAYD
ncbi:MAG: hypothetical protein LBQ67_03475, partial [Treponema sp.]|nr:hypothetical protein [Treponema sp.]